jgi:lactoylglutathione lyase
MELGKFYLSLAVKNINASLEFYQKLGFEIIDGKAADNWVIVQSGTTVIGLFQGMIPENTLSFVPANARSLQRAFKDRGLKILMETDENGKGPAHFMMEDPDGNPILFDQA